MNSSRLVNGKFAGHTNPAPTRPHPMGAADAAGLPAAERALGRTRPPCQASVIRLGARGAEPAQSRLVALDRGNPAPPSLAVAGMFKAAPAIRAKPAFLLIRVALAEPSRAENCWPRGGGGQAPRSPSAGGLDRVKRPSRSASGSKTLPRGAGRPFPSDRRAWWKILMISISYRKMRGRNGAVQHRNIPLPFGQGVLRI